MINDNMQAWGKAFVKGPWESLFGQIWFNLFINDLAEESKGHLNASHRWHSWCEHQPGQKTSIEKSKGSFMQREVGEYNHSYFEKRHEKPGVLQVYSIVLLWLLYGEQNSRRLQKAAALDCLTSPPKILLPLGIPWSKKEPIPCDSLP